VVPLPFFPHSKTWQPPWWAVAGISVRASAGLFGVADEAPAKNRCTPFQAAQLP